MPQHECHPKSIRIKSLIHYYNINLEDFLHNYPCFKTQINQSFSNLSGGQKRLPEVLLVLESESKYSILEEPFSNIMPIPIELVQQSIQKIKHRKGILLTDHQYQNVFAVSDQLYLLTEGQLYPIKDESTLKVKGYLSS